MRANMEFRGEATMENDVNDFLKKAIKMKDATAFIGFVLDGNDKASTIVCANPLHIMGLIQELYSILNDYAGPTKNDTIQ